MKTIFSLSRRRIAILILSLWGLWSGGGLSNLLVADPETLPPIGSNQPPRSIPFTEQPSPSKSNKTWKVLVLPNHNLIEGDIEKIENQYRIRRNGGETWVLQRHALGLCENKKDAYRFLRNRINAKDPDEHLKLAHWCHQRHLDSLALLEVQEVLKLRPDDKLAKRLSVYLQRMKQPAKPAPKQVHDLREPPKFAVEMTSASLAKFGNTVQPILMNACINCHHGSAPGGKTSSFELQRVYGPGLTQRKSTQLNVAAVLKQIDLGSPLQSPFLNKAISLHGGMSRAPFRNREAEPYQRLEKWVRDTIQENPQLAHVLEKTMPIPDPREARPTIVPVSGTTSDTFASSGRPVTPTTEPEAAVRTVPSIPSPTKPSVLPIREVPRQSPQTTQVKPRDPFDPSVFNQQMHPAQPTTSPGQVPSPLPSLEEKKEE